METEEVQSSSPIKFNTKEVKNAIDKRGLYKNDSFIIQEWENDKGFKEEEKEEDLMFVIQNKNKETPFLGVVDFCFKREGYCLNTHSNGDIYFGFYNNDLKNKQGLYSFKPIKKENEILSQYYFGLWKDDLINGRGIYLWLREKEETKPFSDFENANFQAFVGDSENGVFEKGALLSKEADNYFLYYGTFSKDGKKEGFQCFYYSAKLEELCYGTFKDDVFKDGYVGKFNENGDLVGLVQYKKIKKGKFTDFEKISPNNQQKMPNILVTFRNIIMSKDYFGMLYEVFAKIIKFRDENMNEIDTLLGDKYIKLMNDICLFNKVSLCDDIEKGIKDLSLK